ncbi:MAG: dihydrolipoamide acetyltransferase family protein, partial [Novosphingobium sp.]
PVSGTILSVAGEEGAMIAIGSPLVVIEVEGDGEGDGEDGQASSAEPAAPPALEKPQTTKLEPVQAEPVEALPSSSDQVPSREKQDSPSTSSGQAGLGVGSASQTKVLASPAVRARAANLGIDLSQVKPAEDGRIRHADLDAFLAYNAAGGFRAAGTRGVDQTVKVMGLRRRIAENMAASKRSIPHFSYVEECDVTALEGMRAQLNSARGQRPKLTMLPLLISAICRTLPDFPMLNARYDDEAGVVQRFGAVHLGMATQTDGGLMVPVIRDAQDRNLWQLASEIVRLAEAARRGTATSAELSGSTLTITSLGPLGGVATTPVINRPEVAIIGPNRIVERPMFVPDGMGGERIEKRKLMNISISCDHRVVDGWDAASFVQALKRLIETPVLLLAD